MTNKRIILGISGASGVILGYRIAEALHEAGIEIHMVMTETAKVTWEYECGNLPVSKMSGLAYADYEPNDMAARIASGSFRTDGMIVAPCSMKTLAGIVTGYTDNLLLRAVDVCLKEGRKVVLCPREMPLGKVHLRNMTEASELGCVIIPPMLSFYSGQESVEDMLHHIVGKILMQYNIEYGQFRSWEGKAVCSNQHGHCFHAPE